MSGTGGSHQATGHQAPAQQTLQQDNQRKPHHPTTLDTDSKNDQAGRKTRSPPLTLLGGRTQDKQTGRFRLQRGDGSDECHHVQFHSPGCQRQEQHRDLQCWLGFPSSKGRLHHFVIWPAVYLAAKPGCEPSFLEQLRHIPHLYPF